MALSPTAPEGIEGPHVQHGEQLRFGFGKGEAIMQRLKRRHNERCFPLGQLLLQDGGPAAQRKREVGFLLNGESQQA